MDNGGLHHRRRSSNASPAEKRPNRIGSIRRRMTGGRFHLRLSVACNLVLLSLLFFLHTQHTTISAALEGWRPQDLRLYRNSDQVVMAQGTPLVGGSCSMCSVGPEVCERIGESGLLKALSYGGSGDRIRRLIAKLRQGERLTLGVVGGSVSGGHGLSDPDYNLRGTSGNLNRIVFDHLDQLFPAPNGAIQYNTADSGRSEDKNTYVNGAQGGTGTGYFSRCFLEHLPEDMDLVIIEQAINDEVITRNQESYELLVRGLLDLPRQPAVINLNVFQLLFAQMISGGDLHHGVAEYYDLPVLSLRNPLIHATFENQTLIRELFYTKPGEWDDLTGTDVRHIGPPGHRIMGQIAVAYIDHVMCEMEKREAALGLDPLTMDIDVVYPNPPLPRLLLVQQYNETKVFPKLEPNCFSTNSEKHPLVMAKGSEGWRAWNWEKKNYLIADKPGAKISFEFSTKLGEVVINYLRSAEFGLGNVRCWVDDESDRSVWIEGYWNLPYNIGREQTIRTDLTPGDHMLHCELLEQTKDPKGGHEFRIISVMSM